ncbi:threonine-phosphate decarboxylase [Anoxybacillus rupiensis]|uniref:threonine-phosphate decarboxylase CobD n=1 Tax=Anoxybacteroides rupiense TaxID=311460 RepID=UPI001BACF22E|nr:threonine-phosphate decarboxylase CobD [Anoxybacillus rupiensis]MBS2770201.1 threonine-phosphate decarboxylase [Anoxybacillus rupiensis]
MKLPAHGANPQQLYQSVGLSIPDEWIDFSVNTNPFPLPLAVWPTQTEFYQWAMEYPDPSASELKRYLARMEQLDVRQILLGNGASQCIDLLAQLFSGKRIGIAEPTFSEYRRACLARGCEIVSIMADEASQWMYKQEDWLKLIEQTDVIFLCQPNNPTGIVMEPQQLRWLLEKAEQKRTVVVIDEAFIPFCEPSFTAIKWLDFFPRLIVLRSLTKMYHLAGVRVGYIAAHHEIIEQLEALQPPWSISQVAQQLALRLLPMNEFVVHTKRMIAKERERMTAALRQLGYYVSPSAVNFYLLRAPSGSMDRLFYDLLQEGFIPRHTKNFMGLEGRYLRFAVRSKRENDQLLSFFTRWQP